MLTTLMLPVTEPVAAGEKLAVSGKLWPAASVTPEEKPVTLNPVPEAATCESVTLPVPEFVTVIVCDAELPTSVLPKLKLVAFVESKNVCVGAAAMPVPVTPIEIGLPPLWPGVTMTLPLNVAPESGLNAT